MIHVAEYNTLTVLRHTDIGLYLDDGDKGILLPKRFVPEGVKKGDELQVFIHHDSNDRLIATTQQPKGVLGDIVKLRCVSTTPQGAFLDWGLMKDIFVPRSQQVLDMYPGKDYLVKIYIDEQTGRAAATEKIDPYLSNDELSVKEMDLVKLMVYRKSEIGYVMIVNNRHTGMLHNNEVFGKMTIGDKMDGFIKKIYPDNKMDVVVGKPGFDRVEDNASKILRLLQEHNGYLPYNDKSDAAAVHDFFGMSKKTFKMTTGNLYKNRKIIFTQTGIKLLD